MQTIQLYNGIEMPMEGFGVFQVSDLKVCEQAVSEAIAPGYRLIDTASSYKNETAVGAAIRQSGLPHEDFFVTSKVFINEMGYEQTRAAFGRMLEKRISAPASPPRCRCSGPSPSRRTDCPRSAAYVYVHAPNGGHAVDDRHQDKIV